MANKAQIFNLALTLLGQSSISDPNGSGEAEQACRQVYDLCRQSLLEEHPWNFAVKRVALAPNSVAPAFGYTRSFDLPSDSLRIISFYNKTEEHREETGKILTNAATLNLVYIYDLEDTALFSPMFVSLMAHDIALAAEYRVTGQTKMQNTLMEKRRQLLIKAKRVDAQKDQAQKKLKSNRELALYTPYGNIDK